MHKDELLRRLEERLARGEIGEKTYLDIKARYDAMPDLPPVPEAPVPPVPPPPESPRHRVHAGHPPLRNGAFEAMIERTIETAMEGVAANLEAAFSNKEEVSRRMEEVNRRIQAAMSKVGPHIEEGGRVCVIRGSGTVPGGLHFEEVKCGGSGPGTGTLLGGETHLPA